MNLYPIAMAERNTLGLFANFISENHDKLELFERDFEFLKERDKPLKPAFSDFVDMIAQRYSYDFDKFIDAVFLFIEVDGDDIGEYVNELYLNEVH